VTLPGIRRALRLATGNGAEGGAYQGEDGLRDKVNNHVGRGKKGKWLPLKGRIGAADPVVSGARSYIIQAEGLTGSLSRGCERPYADIVGKARKL